jgi:hypothetical protein
LLLYRVVGKLKLFHSQCTIENIHVYIVIQTTKIIEIYVHDAISDMLISKYPEHMSDYACRLGNRVFLFGDWPIESEAIDSHIYIVYMKPLLTI